MRSIWNFGLPNRGPFLQSQSENHVARKIIIFSIKELDIQILTPSREHDNVHAAFFYEKK